MNKVSFEDVYKSIVKENSSNNLQEDWEKYLKIKKKINTIGYVCLAIIDIFLLAIYVSKIVRIEEIFFIIISTLMVNLILMIVIYIFSNIGRGKFYKLLKDVVPNKLLSCFISNLKYDQYQKITPSTYKEVFHDGYDRYNSSDYFEGMMREKYHVEGGYVHTESEEEIKDDDGHTTTEYTTIFSGIFYKVNMVKNIATNIEITGNSWSSKSRLKMDSSEFEKNFDVKTEDKILGMRMLTHDVMEKIVALRKKLNCYFELKVINDNLYLRVFKGQIFNYAGSKELFDKKEIEYQYNTLNDINELLNLIINKIEETDI